MTSATRELQQSTSRNAALLALTDRDIAAACPSVFAKAPRQDVSARYGFVSTADVLAAMREHGFVPTQVKHYHRRDPSNLEFTKHMIRFRKAGENVKKLMVGDVVPQMVLINSHDRSSQFHVYGGLFRLICANGLMVSHGANVQPIVVRHHEKSINGIIDATGALIKEQKLVFEHVDEMKGTVLNEKQAKHFAMQALELRPTRAGIIDPVALLNVRRPEDAGMDLWTVFNRCQENLMRGGLTGITANNRAVVTRGVEGVNGDLKINIGLWALAMEAIATARTTSGAAVRSKAASKAASKAPSGAAQG